MKRTTEQSTDKDVDVIGSIVQKTIHFLGLCKNESVPNDEVVTDGG